MNAGRGWLIDETRLLTEANLDFMDRELANTIPSTNVEDEEGRTRGMVSTPALAVCLHDIVIHNTRKWFGEADIRIDILVVTGSGHGNDLSSFYMPKTVTFARVNDGDRLPIGDGGLLVFHGVPLHFLDLMIMVSQDRKDTNTLATILSGGLKSDEAESAVGSLLSLAVAAPEVVTVTAAMKGAAFIGDLTYRLLNSATGSTIGLYRNSHLQYRDGFGIGEHPGAPRRVYRVNDLSFRYEILKEGHEPK